MEDIYIIIMVNKIIQFPLFFTDKILHIFIITLFLLVMLNFDALYRKLSLYFSLYVHLTATRLALRILCPLNKSDYFFLGVGMTIHFLLTQTKREQKKDKNIDIRMFNLVTKKEFLKRVKVPLSNQGKYDYPLYGAAIPLWLMKSIFAFIKKKYKK